MNEITLTSDITVRLVQKCGGDHMVLAARQASTDFEKALEVARSEATEAQYGKIRHAMRKRHGSCFEHSFLTFAVDAPVFVWRQWMRHRIASYNEESQRYHEVSPKFWVPRESRRMVVPENFRPAYPVFLTAPPAVYDGAKRRMIQAYESAYHAYRRMIEHERVAPEVARAVLPSAIYSSCWVSMNPRSLMNFLSLRVHDQKATYESFPQAEIEEAALVCERIFSEGWPLTHRAFVECGRVAP